MMQMQEQQRLAQAYQQQVLARKIAEQRQREERKQSRIQVVQTQRAEMAAEKERFRQRNLERLQAEQDKATNVEYASAARR